mgnify:CR=1 FL=1
MRNEVRVNKCDEMLRRFVMQCVFLTVTCDFDMLFVVFFRKKGERKEENGAEWMNIRLFNNGRCGKNAYF